MKIKTLILTSLFIFILGVFNVSAKEYDIYRYSVSDDEVIIIGVVDEEEVTGNIVIPSEIDGKPVTAIDGAFENCYELTGVQIPNTVKTIGEWAFAYCESLTNLEIPDSVVSIGEYAFCGCSDVVSVTLGKGVASIGEAAFRDCDFLQSINVSAQNEAFSSEDGVLFNKSKTTLVVYPSRKPTDTYTIPDSVITIGNNAFNKCRNLSSIYIPANVKNLECGAFQVCHLTSITLTEGLVNIGDEAFRICEITSIEIPDSVTTIGKNAFEGCMDLESVTLGSGVTSIGEAAFDNCESLTAIDVDGDNEYFASENGVLFNKNKTELVAYPCGKTAETYTVPNGVTTIGNYAFSHCENLMEINFPSTLAVIGDEAFISCRQIEEIELPGSLKEIGSNAFASTGLTAIDIPVGTERIKSYFESNGLQHLHIGGGIRHQFDFHRQRSL